MIKNIVFDIGNVILKWQPATVVHKLFPEKNTANLTESIFKSPTWYELNLGKITEREAVQIYQKTMSLDLARLNKLMQEIKESLLPINGSFALLRNLYLEQYALYALTDNVREIMFYLQKKYKFWELFRGIVVSAEVGYLKPAAEIYQYLLNTYHINPAESVFIDDHLPNVEGARAAGMQGIQFSNIEQCVAELNEIGLTIKLASVSDDNNRV